MRIISQSGMIDLPYEQVEVCITRTCPNKVVAFSDNGQRELAEYSTPEKAKKAMEMLNEQYMNLCVIKILASGASEHIEKSFNRMELESTIHEYQRKKRFSVSAG